jgi:hypothetical protein
MPVFNAIFVQELIRSLISLAGGIVPIFSSKRSEKIQDLAKDSPAFAAVQSQIIEIQTAVTNQGEALQELSEKLEQSFQAIATSMELYEKKLRWQRWLTIGTLAFAAVVIILVVVLRR